jgi:hypothetical protein
VTERRINVDTLSYQVDNPVVGQPPVSRTAYRGQVVDLPEAVIEHLKGATTRAFYDPLPGSNQRRVREEPVLLDPNPSAGDVESHAAAMARITEMEQEIARLRASAPPVATPLPDIGGTPVVLGPSVTGTVPVEEPTEPAPATLTLQDTGTEGDDPGIAGLAAGDLARLLAEQPDLADAVEMAEQRRANPRAGVLQAVAKARAATPVTT